jgi:hypothetical protein
MSMEFPSNRNEKSEQVMTIVGMDTIGRPIYEATEPLPTHYPQIPKEAFDAVMADLNSLPFAHENGTFNTGEILSLGINSNDKKRYSVLAFQNNYYLLSKKDHDFSENDLGECVVALSSDLKTQPNPDLIVCSQEEILNWMKN